MVFGLVFFFSSNSSRFSIPESIINNLCFRLSLSYFPFRQDCEDSNPLIRALAVRTMGCIRVDKITEYLCEPLRKCLKDEDPYVRKTAAVCVAKLYDISSSMVSWIGGLKTIKLRG
jgi:non-SMC mitotic condensation complex subunit 1